MQAAAPLQRSTHRRHGVHCRGRHLLVGICGGDRLRYALPRRSAPASNPSSQVRLGCGIPNRHAGPRRGAVPYGIPVADTPGSCHPFSADPGSRAPDPARPSDGRSCLRRGADRPRDDGRNSGTLEERCGRTECGPIACRGAGCPGGRPDHRLGGRTAEPVAARTSVKAAALRVTARARPGDDLRSRSRALP
jgi:hypothetical protein